MHSFFKGNHGTEEYHLVWAALESEQLRLALRYVYFMYISLRYIVNHFRLDAFVQLSVSLIACHSSTLPVYHYLWFNVMITALL